MTPKDGDGNCNGECPISRALNLIAGKWTVPIIYHLQRAGGPVRFRQLQRMIAPITQKELTRRLRELERLGLVHRQVFAEVPPRVEYRLTDTGRTLETPLKALAEWVERYGHILDGQIPDKCQRPEQALTGLLA